MTLHDLIGLRLINSSYFGSALILEIDGIWLRFFREHVRREDWSPEAHYACAEAGLGGLVDVRLGIAALSAEDIHELDMTIVLKRNLKLFVDVRAQPIQERSWKHRAYRNDVESTVTSSTIQGVYAVDERLDRPVLAISTTMISSKPSGLSVFGVEMTFNVNGVAAPWLEQKEDDALLKL